MAYQALHKPGPILAWSAHATCNLSLFYSHSVLVPTVSSDQYCSQILTSLNHLQVSAQALAPWLPSGGVHTLLRQSFTCAPVSSSETCWHISCLCPLWRNENSLRARPSSAYFMATSQELLILLNTTQTLSKYFSYEWMNECINAHFPNRNEFLENRGMFYTLSSSYCVIPNLSEAIISSVKWR